MRSRYPNELKSFSSAAQHGTPLLNCRHRILHIAWDFEPLEVLCVGSTGPLPYGPGHLIMWDRKDHV